MTYYDILGISCTAKDSEIKKAYHQMIITFHPDTYQGEKQLAAEKTREIIEAYKVLHNPATKKSYDDFLKSQVQNTQINKNASTSAPRYQYRKDEDTNKDSSYQKTKLKYFNNYTVALSVIGIFVVFVVVLFIIIITSIY